jgi:RHS repeat-associated protein
MAISNNRYAKVLLLFLLALASTLEIRALPPVYSQSPASPDICRDLRYLMALETTPEHLSLQNVTATSGGGLAPGQPVTGEIGQSMPVNYWTFSTVRPLDQYNHPQDAHVDVLFQNIASTVPLEFAVFQGMTLIPSDATSAYQPVVSGTLYPYALPEDGLYTVVVRPAHIADAVSPIQYILTMQPTDGGFTPADASMLDPLSDATTNGTIQPQLQYGREQITFPAEVEDTEGATTWIHAGGAVSVSSRRADGTQIFFDDARDSLLIGEWANEIDLLGGNLSVMGEVEGHRRVFYLESFGYARSFVDSDNLLLTDITDSNGTRVHTDWQNMVGVWMLNDCYGFKLDDGRTFVAQIDPAKRSAGAGYFQGELTGCDQFDINLQTLDDANQSVAYRACFNWDGIAPQSEVTLQGGVTRFKLVGGRSLALQSTNIRMIRQTVTGGPPENARLDIRLDDQDTTLAFDWTNLSAFSLADDPGSGARLMTFEFMDSPRGTVTRPGADLKTLEALDDVIRIQYKDQVQNQTVSPGEERLMLPADEGYIELVTPSGEPTFDGVPFTASALPDQPGYSPRALNNLGAECYPVNTLLEEANCPPNGNINPANGNLWYSVTDLFAHGYLLDLALTRSYDSQAYQVDGPFGSGWTTLFTPDYAVPFDPAVGSRLIDLDNLSNTSSYRVGLDLIWAPRGLVTFTTASGSRHAFVGGPAGGDGAQTLTALTMPDWTLTRADLRSGWQLIQEDTGLVYEFDRVGRLHRYGYPQANRWVTIDYPWGSVNSGPGGLGESEAVTVSDARSQRRLELYFDSANHIRRSVLRDMTQAGQTDPAECAPRNNCFETTYTFTGNHLTEVIYPDGQIAHYDYDQQGVLIRHDDPRAPIAQTMRYDYLPDSGAVATAYLLKPGDPANAADPVVWRSLQYDQTGETRVVTVTDEYTNTRTYTYSISPGTWDAVGSSSTLLSITSPLASVDPFEAQPIVTQWENGLLTDIKSRSTGTYEGRNAIHFGYEDSKLFNELRGGFPHLQITYEQQLDSTPIARLLPKTIEFGNQTMVSFTYEGGKLRQAVDENGAVYEYTWNAQQFLDTLTRHDSDGQHITTWHYQYTNGEVGLPHSVTETSGDGPGYVITYTWDALGRIIQIDDSVLGSYQVSYRRPGEEETCPADTATVVTDPVNSVTISCFDARGRLAETRLKASVDSSDYLRRTTYQYDDTDRRLGQLIAETQWLGGTENGQQPLNTRYTYETISTLDPLTPDGTPTVINGYRITQTDPYDRQRAFTYDALGRIRETRDEFDRVQRYDYFVNDVRNLITDTLISYGLRVVQSEVHAVENNRFLTTTTYSFNLQWQLTGIQQTVTDTAGKSVLTREWGLSINSDVTTNPDYLSAAQSVGIQSLSWSGYSRGRAQALDVRQVDLKGLTEPTRFNFAVATDFLGRPAQIVQTVTQSDGRPADQYTQVAYCELPGGQREELRSMPHTDANTVFDCSSTDVAKAVWYDAHDRVIRISDESGIRVFDYSQLPDDHEWGVQVIAYPPDTPEEQLGQSLAGSFSWQLRYNAAGDLLSWVDEVGFVHRYERDTLGRLQQVSVDGHPEMTLQFHYNAADQLTQVVDSQGQGYVYSYDANGQFVGQQDINTGGATTYAYQANGLLTNTISPSGNITIYQYADPLNPARLTDIIEPTGSRHHYQWDDTTNTLVYTDPLNRQTEYAFDSLGLLVGVVQNPQNAQTKRTYELRYDEAGRLVAWEQTPAGQAFTLNYDLPYQVTVGEASAANWQWTFHLTPSGDLDRLANPDSQEFDFTYDPLGRIGQITAGGQHSWTLLRTDQQPQITVLDEQNQATSLAFDARYHLTQIGTSPADQTTYTYNDSGVDITHAGATRRYLFKPGSEISLPQVELITPGQRVIYTYSAEGLLSGVSREVCMQHLEKITPDNPVACMSDETWRTNIRFEYDVRGLPVRLVDEEQNIETFAYDEAGRLVRYQDFNSKTFEYGYDDFDRLSVITGPSGIELFLAYDDQDRLTGICRTRASARDIVDYATCEAPPAAESQLAGVLETYEYDSLGRLTRQNFYSHVNEGGITSDQLKALAYAYDFGGGGRLTSWGSENSGSTTDLSYTPDGLGFLDTLSTTSGSQYTFGYREAFGFGQLFRLQEIAGDTNMGYTYDDAGRLKTVVAGDHTLIYEYDADNVGYTIRDESGSGLHITRDARGLLASIDYVGAGDSNASAPQVSFEYESHVGNTPYLAVVVQWEDDTQAELHLDRRGETFDIIYPGVNFYVGYVAKPDGQITQQTLSGRDFLVTGTDVYIIVTGYDSDDRPLTMRLTEKATGGLLYVLAFTYDAFGQRETETRQYQDGTQVLITYQYDRASHTQLVSRVVEITRPTSDTSPLSTSQSTIMIGATSLFLGGGLWLSRRRKSHVLRGLVVVTLCAQVILMVPTAGRAFMQSVSTIHTYEYDANGNLAVVTTGGQTCATYSYDSANRLVQTTVDDQPLTYQYDAYNRLVQIGEWTLTYSGTSTSPFAIYQSTGGSASYIGRLPNGPTFFQAGLQGIQQVLHSGQKDVLGTIATNGEQSPAVLYDPLGREVTLEFAGNGADQMADPCHLFTPAATKSAQPPQLGFNGMLGDAQTGLYFLDGRVYMPELGRFLQRDPDGPDVLGNLYDYPPRQAAPPIQYRSPSFMAGLRVLETAMETRQFGAALTADAVSTRYGPAPHGETSLVWSDLLNQSERHTWDQLISLLNFPVWLADAYDLPGAALDRTTGAVQVPQQSAPGQGGWGTASLLRFDTPLWQADGWSAASISSPLSQFESLVDQTVPQAYTYPTAYLPDRWRPDVLQLDDTWNINIPVLDYSQTPGAVMAWLPDTLVEPQNSTGTLDLAETLMESSQWTGYQWVSDLLAQSLPQTPDLPPVGVAGWLGQWFHRDTLGIAETLNQRWPVPQGPGVPIYDFAPEKQAK